MKERWGWLNRMSDARMRKNAGANEEREEDSVRKCEESARKMRRNQSEFPWLNSIYNCTIC